MSRLPLLALFASLPALAAEPVVVDIIDEDNEGEERCSPAIACSAKLAVTEQVTIEAGSNGRNGEGELVHAGQMIAFFPLRRGLEFMVYSDTLVLASAEPRSSEAVQPGFKVSLVPEGELTPSFDVSLHLTLPTTWRPDATWDFEGWAYFAKKAGPVTANLNVILLAADLAGTPKVHGVTTLSLVRAAGGGVNLFSEAYATWGDTLATPPGGGVFAGLSVAATDTLVFDAGVEVGYHAAARYTLFAGLTWMPGGHQRPHGQRSSPSVRHVVPS